MFREKKTIFDRLSKIINNHTNSDDEIEVVDEDNNSVVTPREEEWGEESNEEGQLAIDVYQTPSEITLHAMVAGVKPDDLEVSITREMVTIKGKRERAQNVTHDDYFFQELYWGVFSRTIVLPEEIDVETSEAATNHGLLTIHLPKIDRKKTQKLKIKSL